MASRGFILGMLLATLFSIPWIWDGLTILPEHPNQGMTRDNPASAEQLLADELMLEGWSYLNTLENPIILWDGRSVTGYDLAQFLVNNQIPVIWGNDAICSGSSCSRLFCRSNGFCAFDDGEPGVDPIYLNTGIREMEIGIKERVAKELAHEIFHRMQPFGTVTVTLFEEYWAFYLDEQIHTNHWPLFHADDTKDAVHLRQWFRNHALNGYLQLDAYPEAMQPSQGRARGGSIYPESGSKNPIHQK